ncbi:hypothetical protein HY212_04790 [Candidatus Pacearchaeota archaeon]|nr:hypothetical protein [Candidatus Pacearchaeota archaeon]
MKKSHILILFLAVSLAIVLIQSSKAAACTPSWQCSEWSSCIENTQIRNCYDINLCGISQDKPIERQTCGTQCTPDWKCSQWDPSNCSETQLQTRTCTDNNNCNILAGKPEEAKACQFSKNYNWMFLFIVAVIIILIVGAIWLLIKKARNNQTSLYLKQETT